MNDSNPSSSINHAKVLREALESPAAAVRPGIEVPAIEELAPHFPDFEILEVLGRGGMGVVYRARQRRLERDVAIKVMPRSLAASDPEFGERFLREARALASLNHQHIITVHDFGEVEGLFYLVTECVDGVDLRKLMQMGALTAAEALRITPAICDALHYAHGRGVVHRDIKPENILVDTDGRVKIADFGLAKLVTDGATFDPVALTRTTAVFGTPNYMAPEQMRGSGAVDHRADIFSLGVVLYEMLTGQLPMGHFDPPSSKQGVPEGLDAVVRRTLAQQPENRYQDAKQVRDDLQSEAQSLKDVAETPAGAKPATTRVGGGVGQPSDHREHGHREAAVALSMTRWLAVLALMTVLGVVALAVWKSSGSSRQGVAGVEEQQGLLPELGGVVDATGFAGLDFDAVLARLGPPSSMVASSTGLKLFYPQADSGKGIAALRFGAAGKVVWVAPEATALQSSRIPERGAWCGRSFSEYVRTERDGRFPSEHYTASIGTIYVFEGGRKVFVVDGRILR